MMSARDRVYCRGEICLNAIDRNVAAGASLERLANINSVCFSCHKYDGGVWRSGENFSGGCNAAHVRQSDIKQDENRVSILGKNDGFPSISRFSYHPKTKLALHEQPQAVPNDWISTRNKNTGGHGECRIEDN